MRLDILAWAATVYLVVINAEPAPIVCTSSTEYVGYDGTWSPITIRVGSPEQWLSVLPSTLSQETWVMGLSACDGTSACQSARGGLFSSNDSSTFQSLGLYELGSSAVLGDSQVGYYGLDTISLNDMASETNQIIAVLNTSSVWVGEIGLGVQQTRINGSETRLPFLSSLVQNNSMIPSHSFGYTAGAAYLLKGVPASLTLGGVDQNRFSANNLNLTLNSDYAPVVAVNSISVATSSEELPPTWNANPTALLENSEGATFTIDSSTPFLWMPPTVCERFADALGLYYNETLELYFYNDTISTPDSLAQLNLTFTFEIGNLPGSTDNVELALSYGAFDLELSYGFPGFDGNFTSPNLPYFPLRRALSATQYILGRAFLQETYLAVDYERNTFSLSQAVITEQSVNNVNLAAITRPANSIFPGPTTSESSGLSGVAKAGIGVGVALAVVACLVLVWCLVRRKRRASSSKSPFSEKSKARRIFSRSPKSPGSNTTVSELIGDKRQPTELNADNTTTRFELPASPAVEMPAAEVSPTFFQNTDGRSNIGSRGNLGPPAARGVPGQRRHSKEEEAEAAGSERSASPVPPYSPEHAQRLSDSVSPYSARHSRGFGTVSSGEPGISPVGNSSGNPSERNSNSVPSPVSPDVTFHRAFSRFTQGSEPSSNESSYGQHLTPHIPDRVPSRSPSRGSRFVEEGLGDASGVPPSSSRSARFSWEE
jgi:hypothetical protein